MTTRHKATPAPVHVHALIAATIFSAIAASSSGFDVRYWVWQRDDPLDEQELAELAVQRVDTIYWHVGELENVGEAWRWKARFNFPSSTGTGIHFVPVVRLVSREHQPFSDASITALLARLSSASAKQDELQLDYDAPDRLLADYSAALKRIHRFVPKLTITALPHWSCALQKYLSDQLHFKIPAQPPAKSLASN